ncbi:MAG: ATP-binding protein [Acidobacteriota bacterium]
MLRFQKAQTRIAIPGALASMVFLALLALLMRTTIRSLTFAEIDEELRTLSTAIGSDLELQGIEQLDHSALRAGMESNLLEFRLENHSAILFSGARLIAKSGDLAVLHSPAALIHLQGRNELPFTAVEPFSGRGRLSRFRVLHLGGKADGTSLVIFRSIGSTERALERLDAGLVGFVILSFLGTAAILALAVQRALRPVEEVTRVAEKVEATDLSGRITGVVGGGIEFQRLAAVINSLFDRLQQAFESQQRLIADAAHELKTPTAVIVAEAQEAMRPETPEPVRQELIESINRAARSMAREVDDLLTLARGETAQGRATGLDLADVAQEAMSSAQPLADRRAVSLTLAGSGEAPVRGDESMVLRMATNVLSNAILYSSPGGDVEIRTGNSQGMSWIEISDRGPGLSQSDSAAIFGRFVRLPFARERNPEGSGLGLAIVDQVVRSHHGQIVISPRSGGGSVFRIAFPESLPTAGAEAGGLGRT